MKSSIYQFSAPDITGKEVSLSDYSNQVVLIVNTASKCGFTSQYQGLESLYKQFKSQGFTVLGFPCNQFAQQEKGSESEIAEFCELNFGVTFPLFSKVDVNGENAHPLFQFIKKEAKGLLGTEKIKWNFTKFLVNKQGKVIKRYAPATKPDQLIDDIKALL
ncbi:glutathione peroxidase [Parashewanella curva]|uniref:Glutathione peroxidase n=1 Tax=Parashewanella curva TaxID=2338552 RepID=A0A3L8Q1N5_9GAMM|nr:glutathione peroxidase [Parashewanella curva]RLV61505.1 glutathione peroxidase [Parashewanella curva]